MFGIGAGVRFLVLTLGPRARFGLLDNFDVITVGGELGLRPPFGIFEPHLDLGGGYASVSQLESPTRGRELSADGGYARVSGRLVKVMAWYDNEWGFSNRMLDTARAMYLAQG